MEKIRVIGKITLTSAHIERLNKLGVVEYIAISNPDRGDKHEILFRIADASIILNNISTPMTADILQKCPNVKFIQTLSTGTDNVDIEYARANGIRVANIAGFSTESVAEKTIGLMIIAANQLIEANKHATSGGWDYQRFTGLTLKEKTLCLVGYGKIAKRVEELACAFGMTITKSDSRTSKEELAHLFKKAEFISIHCPLNSNTYHLISTEQFNAMNSVILINNSRGGVVDENALLQALETNKVKFATIDVFEKEPPDINNQLLKHSKVFVTPHCAWNTKEALEKLTDTAINNIELFTRGELKSFIV